MSGSDSYTMVLHRDDAKDAAILVSETGASRQIWLPRAKIEFKHTGKFWQARIGAPKLAVIEVSVPRWLVEREGLL